jgi:hypothetical protein
MSATKFLGAVFDGRYIYAIPSTSVAVRLDTQADFASSTSWTSVDLSVLDPTAGWFEGGAFDGRYVYAVPHGNLDAHPAVPGIVARYDTTAPFTAAASWSKFALTQVDPNALAYAGAVFDGRYLHLVPTYSSSGTASGTAIRYDTAAAFTSKSAWTKFDLTSIDPNLGNYYFGAFDGRYVTFVPYGDYIVRYDTLATYSDPNSWSYLGLSSAGLHAGGYQGAVFTGEFLYLIPWVPRFSQRYFVRFDAKTPPSMPHLPAYSGSFF